jgi:signal peptidase I
MEHSLLPGDRVVVDKTAYGLRIPLTKIDILGGSTPRRGDIAVFDSPHDGTRLIKRIVAIGGDTVSMIDGHLTINGERIGSGAIERFGDVQALLNLTNGGGPDIGHTTVPAGVVLALGDHRGNSMDGRYFGLIDERELYGRAIAIYYRRADGFVWRAL